MTTHPIPRLPVFGWSTLTGSDEASVPCMLDLPGAIYTTSGRASILLALEALGIGAGHEVLLPSYHCPTMVAPAVHLNATPVFYPITETGAPDLAWMASRDLSRVRVLLVAHFFGLPQPMDIIRAWCDERGVALLEDCAHALFGRSGARPIGAWGDLAIGSLTKFLPMSTGGCLVSNKCDALPELKTPAVRAGARVLFDGFEVAAQHGRLAGFNSILPGALAAARRLRGRVPAEAMSSASMPAPAPDLGALSGIDAALAHQSLPGVGRWMATSIPRGRIVDMRRQRYRQLAQQLSGHQGLRPLMPELSHECAPYVFPLWVDAPDPGYGQLRALRMPVSRWDWLWPSVPRIDGDQGVIWSHHVLQLACHQDISDADLSRFVEVLLDLYATAPASVRTRAAAALQND